MAVAQSHAGPLSLICVSARESSPVDDVAESKSETKKKRFHPFRNLRRIFRRKSRQLDVADAAAIQERVSRTLEPRCSSTGRLLEEDANNARRRSSSLAPGLSLSHDSVFNPEKTDSGHSSSDLENSSLSIPILIPTARAELANVVRRRVRDDSDDEDLGLPRSRCSSLAAEFPDKERTVKSQSSCSEGSLLSTGSSLEDDLQFTGQGSDLDLKVTRHKLSHSAAKHKMAVRPRRNHGAPGAKRALPKSVTSLPATPEVNEESGAFISATIDVSSSNPVPVLPIEPLSVSISPVAAPVVEIVPAVLIPSSPIRPDTWSKSASLPHGAALSGSVEPKVARSLSSAGTKRSSDPLPPVPTKDELKSSVAHDDLDRVDAKEGDQAKKQDMPRASLTSKSLTRSVERRQRMDPVDIPPGPTGFSRMRISYSTSPPKPMWPASLSPPNSEKPEAKVDLKDDSLTEKTHFIKNESKIEPKFDNERTGLYIKNDNKLRRDSGKPPIQKSQSFHKDVPAPVYNFSSNLSKNIGDEDSNKRLYLKNRNIGKCVRKEDKESLNAKLTKKSASLESIGSQTGSSGSLAAKSASSESVRSVVVTHEEPRYANLKNFLLKNYDQIHHGYENIEIIELVRKEKELLTDEVKSNVPPEDISKPMKERKAEPEIIKTSKDSKASLELSRDSLEIAKDAMEKPVEVIDKPKSPSGDILPEFMRVQLKDNKNNNKLVERRKSELLLGEEADLSKQMTRSFRKQVSLQDTVKEVDSRIKRPVSLQESSPVKDADLRGKPALHSKPGENVVIVEKQEEVVLRRKSQSTDGEEPELMKVFARRSLKIKDDGKDGEDESGKARDSDKENDVFENVKEESKKIEEVRNPAIPLKPVAPLKPAVAARNNLVSKFVRNLSESLTDEGKTITDVKNKINGAEKPPVSGCLVIDTGLVVPNKRPVETKITAVKDNHKDTEKSLIVETKVLIKDSNLDGVKLGLEKSDDAEEPGFKRIQDRRAEWERRLQAAK